MRRWNPCLNYGISLICFIVFLLPGLISSSTVHALTASHGRPYHGRLVNGIPFPSQFRGYQLREADRTYTTPEVVGALLDAIEGVRTFQPNTCDLYLGDFSLPNGGPSNNHRSHQNGRDVDLGMYAKGNRRLNSLVPMNEENLDAAKTWVLIEGLLRSQRVQYIFLDRRVQKLLFDYASSQGVDQGYLERLFANDRSSIVKHVVNHVDHIHVRFFTPWSTLAAHIDENDTQKRTVIEMAQQSYLPKKVQYYAKGSERGLEALARSFGVTSKDLCRWNNLHGSEVLAPGSCLVFYKRGFELEPVHLAQSLQPSSMPQNPVKLVSLRPARATLSDAPAALEEKNHLREKIDVPAVSTYTAQRGDTLDKVAKRFGMDPKALGEINGLKKNATLRHGQRIKLGGAKVNTASAPNQTLTDTSKTRPGKPLQTAAVPVLDSKKAKAPAPVFYTVGKGDKLPKIAKETGVAVETLCRINGIRKNAALRPGQKLQLAYAEPATKTVSSDASSKLRVYRPQTLSKASAPAPVPASYPPAKAVSTTKQAALSPKSTSQAKTVAPAPKTATSAKAASKGKSSPAAVAAIATGPSKASAAASKAAPAAKSVSTSAAKTATPPVAKSSPSVAAKNSSNTSGKPSKNSTTASPSKATGSAKPMKEARR